MNLVHPGAVGTTITAGTGVLGVLTNNIPVLQAISLIVSIVVGTCTLAWYAYKFGRVLYRFFKSE